MRVLVTVSPQLYGEAIALSIRHHLPGLEVRVSPPEDAELELAGFRPNLLAYNDTASSPRRVSRASAPELRFSNRTAWTRRQRRTGWSSRCATRPRRTC